MFQNLSYYTNCVAKFITFSAIFLTILSHIPVKMTKLDDVIGLYPAGMPI